MTGTISAEFYELMPLVVDVFAYEGEDQWGNNSYATTAVCHRARAENPMRTIEGALLVGGRGATDPDTVRLIVDYIPTSPVKQRDRVVIGPDTYTVVSQTTEYDENGPYYQDLMCSNNKEQ